MEVLKVDPAISSSPYKFNNHRNPRILPSRSTENFYLQQHHGGGILFAPPQNVYFSLPSIYNNNRQQPPLLPLPIPKPYPSFPTQNRTRNQTRNLSVSPPTKKMNLSSSPHTKKISGDYRKSKSPKKPNSSFCKVNQKERCKKSEVVVTDSNNNNTRLGPEPSDLPKGVACRVLKPVVTVMEEEEEEEEDEEEIVMLKGGNSGSIFSLAPPPSSLPLPSFSMKPKIGCCNLEAAGGIDAGATDNLCRLLRLRY